MEICSVSIKPSFSTNDFDDITQKLRLKHTIIGFIDGHITPKEKTKCRIFVNRDI